MEAKRKIAAMTAAIILVAGTLIWRYATYEAGKKVLSVTPKHIQYLEDVSENRTGLEQPAEK